MYIYIYITPQKVESFGPLSRFGIVRDWKRRVSGRRTVQRKSFPRSFGSSEFEISMKFTPGTRAYEISLFAAYKAA